MEVITRRESSPAVEDTPSKVSRGKGSSIYTIHLGTVRRRNERHCTTHLREIGSFEVYGNGIYRITYDIGANGTALRLGEIGPSSWSLHDSGVV